MRGAAVIGGLSMPLRRYVMLLHNYHTSLPTARMTGSRLGPQRQTMRWDGMEWDTGSIRHRTGLRRHRAGFLRRAGSLPRNGLRLRQGGSCGLTIRYQRPALPLSARNTRRKWIGGQQLASQVTADPTTSALADSAEED
jgi:hypothetical protein